MAASAAILFHLTAVASFPFFVSTDGASPFAEALYQVTRPYVHAVYLDHGYNFFAPNPGSSVLIRYKLEFDDGRPAIEGTFPDIEVYWPRLFYHRHFMLSAQIDGDYAPPELPAEFAGNERETQIWKDRRKVYETKWKSFEQHLLARYGADKVTLTRIEHRPPSPYEVVTEGKKLSDSDLYRELPETAASVAENGFREDRTRNAARDNSRRLPVRPLPDVDAVPPEPVSPWFSGERPGFHPPMKLPEIVPPPAPLKTSGGAP